MAELNWEQEDQRNEKIDEIIVEVRAWDASFENLQEATQEILDRLQAMQDNADGLYNALDRPLLVSKLAARRAALNAWEDAVPG